MDAVVFNGMNTLDFDETRWKVARIPEVAQRLREAQEIWDAANLEHFDFLNFLLSDDSTYLRCLNYKSLATAIVQVGLYDRYIKQFQKPEFLVGNSNGDSTVKVAIGEINFKELILSSRAAKNSMTAQPMVAPTGLPNGLGGGLILAGVSLTEYSAYKNSVVDGMGKFEVLNYDKMNVVSIVQRLIDEAGVTSLVSVGPGNQIVARLQQEMALSDVQFSESIAVDPMLSWFWRDVNAARNPHMILN